MLKLRKVTKLIKIILSLLVCLSMFYAIRSFYRVYSADKDMMKAEGLLQQGNYVDSLSGINDAIAKNPQEPIYLRTRAKIYLALGVGPDEKEVFKYKSLALKDLNKAYKLNPDNLATVRNIVPLYYYLAIKDLSIPASVQNIDPIFIGYAEEFYKMTAEKYPNDVGVYVLLAKYENKLNLQDDLRRNLERIRFLRPDLLEWNESLRDLNVSF